MTTPEKKLEICLSAVERMSKMIENVKSLRVDYFDAIAYIANEIDCLGSDLKNTAGDMACDSCKVPWRDRGGVCGACVGCKEAAKK